MSWERVKLSDLAHFIRGVTFKPEDKVEVGEKGSVVCFRTSNVQKKLDQDDLIAIPRYIVKRSEQFVRFGDLLISSANSWNLVGKACWIPKLEYEATLGGFISALRVHSDRLDARYLYHWFTSTDTQNIVRSFGRQTTNISNLDFGRTLALEVPLPPLPIQQRIAAVLDEVDALRQKRERSIEILNSMPISLYEQFFGNPFINPHGFPIENIDALAIKFTDGPFGSNLKSSHYRESGIRVIRLQNVGVGFINDNDKVYIDEAHYNSLPRNHVKSGDVIFGTLGEPVVRAFVVPNNIERALNKADCLLFRPKNDKVLAEYVSWTINHPSFVNEISGLALGQTRLRVSLGRFREMSIPVPPLSLQKEFIEAIKFHLSSLHDQQMSQQQIEVFQASLQARAFSGALALRELTEV